MRVADVEARSTALDSTRSFCVSAPAGSGKTELLIQRFLALLATVERPEQVLAITFTRKAAAEMRGRIMQALADAQQDVLCAGEHARVTRALACEALAMDGKNDWQLLSNINRLNVKTIDSFCAGLTRQMPVLSRFGGQASATDDPEEMYYEAVRELFSVLDSNRPAAEDLAALLLHFDNNWDRLQALLVAMLARRDQWREYIGIAHTPEESERYLQKVVRQLVVDLLSPLSARLSIYEPELFELLCYQARNLGIPAPATFPAADPSGLAHWRQLLTLLLTKSGGWRSRVDKSMGFPAGKGRADEYRERLTALIVELRELEGLHELLLDSSYLPDTDPDNQSWQLLIHLSRVLPLLAANLLLVFQSRGLVDHSQVALSALDALGDDEQPTELALRLDYTFEHILVDEFQDTAINQYELIRRLTRGWREHNEQSGNRLRTLFIVGDGMQSIYGFRDANVSLFLQARNHGFNGLQLEYLQLTSNFRSSTAVVDWVNDTFSSAFPEQDDVARGQVSFSKAQAVNAGGVEAAVALHAFRGERATQAEAEFIADAVRNALTEDPEASVAVLARTRSQLPPILEVLRKQQLDYAAQDIESLRDSPVIADLLILVRVLVNRFDRLAWLSLLRAPWCGLELQDLLLIGSYGDSPGEQPIARALADKPLRASLSDDGQSRLAWTDQCMQWAEQQRDRLSLREWIEELWVRLCGPGVVARERGLADAERFFQLLEQADSVGVGLDIHWLLNKLDKLYADPGDNNARVQVMTLHKAKGLEFDCVIIPDLARRSRPDSRDLMLWDEHSTSQGQRQFLLAVDDHSKKESPSLYNYLRQERKRKTLMENTRLLYVGATRAVSRLIMTAIPGYDEAKERYREPGELSLLATIWPVFEQQMIEHVCDDMSAVENTAALPGLVRTARPPVVTMEALEAPEVNRGQVPRFADNMIDRAAGTAVHRLLEALAQIDPLPTKCDKQQRSLADFVLRSLGLHGTVLTEAGSRVMEAVDATLADQEYGRWILSSDHAQSACELRLSTADDSGTAHDIVVDRTFVDCGTGVRWVIDYKTSRPADDQPLTEFLAQEAASYAEQLQGYRHALTSFGEEPIEIALYFAAIGCFHRL